MLICWVVREPQPLPDAFHRQTFLIHSEFDFFLPPRPKTPVSSCPVGSGFEPEVDYFRQFWVLFPKRVNLKEANGK